MTDTLYTWAALMLTPITGIVSWIVARRSRNNTMLQQMQTTIDMLLKKNNELIVEITLLRAENLDLRTNQERMLDELQELRALTHRTTP